MEAEGVAVVTGASRGIGRAVALALAKRGFEVVATMRDPAAGSSLVEEAERARGKLRVERLDVTRPDEFEMPSGLRVFVSNAVASNTYLPVEELPERHWRDIFETNVLGPLSLMRRAIPLLRANGGGVICSFGSTATHAPLPFMGPYRASKAAIGAACETLRIELAPLGIRVIEVVPGPIQTDALDESPAVRPAQPADPAYGELARRQFEGNSALAARTSSVDTAVGGVIAAILADDGPMRYAIDPVSERSLAAWRGSSDEDMERHIRKLLGLP